MSNSTDELPVNRRQSIFQALVDSQDRGLSVVDSRAEIVRQFSITLAQLKDVEREGLANQWPPL